MDTRFRKIICTASLAVLLGACGGNGEELTQEGMDAVARQEYLSAQDIFARALSAGGDKEEIYRGLGLSYMGQQEYSRALGSFSSALKEAPATPGETEFDINYYMAVCYYKLGEYDEAIGRYDAITNLRKKESRAWYLKGSMKLYLNDLEGALSDFDTAVAAKKNDHSLCIDIYDRLLTHGHGEDAQKYFDMVDDADPKEISDYDKGRLCYYRAEYGQAANYLERARQEAPSNAELIALLGDCYKKQDQYDYAAVVYAGFVDEYNDAQICNQLGLCYVEQGDFGNALAAFQRGLEIKENNTCVQALKINEISSLEHLGQYAKAEERLAAYIETYGSTPLLEKEEAFLITR